MTNNTEGRGASLKVLSREEPDEMDVLLAYSEEASATSLSHTFPQDCRKKRFLRFFARDGPSHVLTCTPTGKDYWSPKCSGLNYYTINCHSLIPISHHPGLGQRPFLGAPRPAQPCQEPPETRSRLSAANPHLDTRRHSAPPRERVCGMGNQSANQPTNQHCILENQA